MNVIYFSHSYRREDASFVRFFLDLLSSERLYPSLDPPSDAVNAAKLQRHLRSCDAMVSILSRRGDGYSPHIEYEISLALQARVPLLVFVEDTLPNEVVPARVLQRRFSRQSLPRQTKDHRHALRILKEILGDELRPSYQPPLRRRTCLTVGLDELSPEISQHTTRILDRHGYDSVEASWAHASALTEVAFYEALACSSLAISWVDSLRPRTQYILGAASSVFVPTIGVSTHRSRPHRDSVPAEYWPRQFDGLNTLFESLEGVLDREIELFEQDFLELEDQAQVARYTQLLLAAGSGRAGHYDSSLRNSIALGVTLMRDQYNVSGQSGAVGPHAQASDIEFHQVWNQTSAAIDLDALLSDLGRLRSALRKEATEPEHDIAVAEVGMAEISAKEHDGPGILMHLASAGRWALNGAIRIGTPVAAEVIKKAIGL